MSASAILLQTEDAIGGTVIDSQKVVRTAAERPLLRATCVVDTGSESRNAGKHHCAKAARILGQAVGMSANGARDTQNRFYYDGIEAMDLDSYSFSFSPSIDAIMEFKVQSSTYSADIGGAPGGQVNLTTKSGTNTFHGGAWWFNRNDAFTALNAIPTSCSGREAAKTQPQPIRREPGRSRLAEQDVLLLQLGIGTSDRRIVRRSGSDSSSRVARRRLLGRRICDSRSRKPGSRSQET